MIYEDDIPKYHGTKVMVSREDYDAFCDSEVCCCAGSLISYFEFWHKVKKTEAYKRVEEGLQDGITEKDLYQHHSQSELVSGIRNYYAREKVSGAIELLISKNVLKIVGESHCNRHQARTYLFNPEPIKDFVNEHFSSRDRKNDFYNNSRDRKNDSTNIKSESNTKESDSKESVEAVASGIKLRRRSVINNEESKEDQTLSNKEVNDGVEKEENKPKLVRRTPSIFPSIQVQELFRYWNNSRSHGKTLEKPEIGTFKVSVKMIAKALHKYSVDQIKQSMDNYHSIINNPLTLLNNKAPGHVVTLVDFFDFTEGTIDRINKGNANYPSKRDFLKDVTCWFEECLQDMTYLNNKFVEVPKCAQDDNPTITLELEKQYRANVNSNQITPNEHNMFIIAAKRLVDWHRNMSPKINFNSCPLEKEFPRAFAHRMIEAVLDNVQDKSIIQVNWLVTDTQFNVRLTNYLKKLGMLDISFQSKTGDLITVDNVAKKKEEIANLITKLHVDYQKVRDRGLSEEDTKLGIRKVYNDHMVERAAIIAKYDGTSKPVEEKKSNNDWMYDSE